MITLKNINKTYYNGSPLHVLKGINLEIEKGEMVSIMGASGSGKSTLLNILGALDTYDTGDYFLNNILIKGLSETKAAEIRNKTIGFIFQSFNLITFKNAMENVALPLYYQGISRKKRNATALEYLDRLGLKDWWDHMPNELSGGQKQRVAIARALIAKPQIILADEPTGALDSKTSDEVMDILREVNETGMTMIIVTHERFVAEATNKIIHIKDGTIESIEITGQKLKEPKESIKSVEHIKIGEKDQELKEFKKPEEQKELGETMKFKEPAKSVGQAKPVKPAVSVQPTVSEAPIMPEKPMESVSPKEPEVSSDPKNSRSRYSWTK